MGIIDLTEIPSARHPSEGSDDFELFARDFLEAIGCRIIQGPSRGADGGCDLLVSDPQTGKLSSSQKFWLVSVKHTAHSRRSVGSRDEVDPIGRVKKFKASGFLAFYSSVPSSGLANDFELIKSEVEVKILDKGRIEDMLLTEACLDSVFRQYLPASYRACQPPSLPEKLQLKADTGFRDLQITVSVPSVLDKNTDGSLRLVSKDMEAIMVAYFLAQNLRAANFSALSSFISFSPLVWKQLILLLKESGFRHAALAKAIREENDSFQLRLLISIAGEVHCGAAVEPICERTLREGGHHRKVIGSSGFLMTPFLDVAKEALGLLPPTTRPVIERYLKLASDSKRWREKRVFEDALKIQKRG